MLYYSGGWQHPAGVVSTLPKSPLPFLAVGLLCLAVDVPALPQESPIPFLAVGLLCLAVDVPALPQESPIPFLSVGLLFWHPFVPVECDDFLVSSVPCTFTCVWPALLPSVLQFLFV